MSELERRVLDLCHELDLVRQQFGSVLDAAQPIEGDQWGDVSIRLSAPEVDRLRRLIAGP